MNARILFSILFGVGVAAAIVVAYRANERRFGALQQQMRAVAEQSRERGVHEAARPVYVYASQPGTPAAPTADSPMAPESPPAADADESAQTPSGRGITEEEQAAHVDMAFSAETTDRAWAQQTERAIGGSLRGLAQNSTLDGVECRQTLCKASLRHPDQTKFSDFLDRVSAGANELWTGPIYAHRESLGTDGVVHNTIYFAKQGHSFPSPE